MSHLRIVGGADMRGLDRLAIQEMGVPGLTLMENAGRAVARAALALVTPIGRAGPEARAPSAAPPCIPARILIVAGKGNNAGDGFVAARHLLAAGCDVKVALADGSTAFSGDAAHNLDTLKREGIWEKVQVDLAACRPATAPISASSVRVSPVAASPGAASLDPWIEDGPTLVIDAILGTGLTGAPRGPMAEAINLVNEISTAGGCPVLAVDVPSGLDTETGDVPGPCVHATETVTFGFLKNGLVVYPGAGFAGRVSVADIGFPPALEARVGAGETGSSPDAFVLGPGEAAALLPARPAAGHKGTFGHVLCIAGSARYAGAAWLCAAAAPRAGAGLSTLASVPDVLAARGPFPEIIARPLASLVEAGESGAFWDLADYDALALGPGLGQGVEARQLVLQLLTEVLPSAATPPPTVLDADALNIVAAAGGLGILRGPAPFILTPHPGELARLMGLSAAKVQSDRLGSALAAARLSQSVVCLKGARTVIASPSGAIRVIPFGNPGMATGGSGDVLTGVMAAFLAAGAEPFSAACAGAFIHAVAGDLAATQLCGSTDGAAGLMARDIMDRLPAAMGELRRGEITLDSITRLP